MGYGNDVLNQLDSDHSYSTSSVTENSLNLGKAGKNLGNQPLFVKFTLKSMTSGLTSGVKLQAVDASVKDLTTDIRAITTVELTEAEVLALIAAGRPVFVPVRPGVELQQFLGGRIVPVTEAAVALIVDTYVVTGAESQA